jgi:HlyD family secretion protein
MSAFAPAASLAKPARRLLLPVAAGLLLVAVLLLQVRPLRHLPLAAGLFSSHPAAAPGTDGAGAPGTDGAPSAGGSATATSPEFFSAPGDAPRPDTANGTTPPQPLAGERVAAEGRLVAYPGAQVVVSTDLAGTLVRLTAEERQTVRRGQLLAELRSDDRRAELAEAQAKADEAAADLRFAAQDADRSRFLADQKAGTRREAERTASLRDSAAARLATAQAEVRRLEALLAKTRITAPLDGTVVERAVQPGEHVEAGASLLTIADLRRTRIEAEVDEFDAGHVAAGAAVRVTVEGFAGRAWRAHVEEIPETVVARKLRPQDPGRPADTRVLLVKIALDEPSPIKLGQRVEVAIAPPPRRGAIG